MTFESQMKPSHDSFHNIAEGAYPPTSSSPGQEAKPLLLSSQLWLRSGSCPEGTIPIRRVQRHHLLNAPSIKSYGKRSTTGKEKYEFSLLNKTLGFGIEAMHSVSLHLIDFQYDLSVIQYIFTIAMISYMSFLTIDVCKYFLRSKDQYRVRKRLFLEVLS